MFDWSIHPDVLYFTLAVLVVLISAVAWVGNVFMLPGNWLVVGLAALWAWQMPFTEYERGFGWGAVIGLGLLAAFGEIIEAAASAAGAAKKGGSKRGAALAILGAGVGSILGVAVGIPIPFFGPFVGALLGGGLGAFGGAYLGEIWKGRNQKDSADIGTGAMIGKVLGTLGRMAAGAAIVALLTIFIFWPR
ncbi:DUF456 domain-containing protein [Calycomorphotria hydatis]|uniref:DUF456 domain-containing protein n=1 Tax=Calycomorphotria hydatis TaxID=2528027 RepID=A0A517T5Q8_9PLAN|nr:DUF456 domain-containing protein [Calycomorphotria hydatis]QDT63698.1 hypothetical protein V22_09230 [Calycomorphotria hydatis]